MSRTTPAVFLFGLLISVASSMSLVTSSADGLVASHRMLQTVCPNLRFPYNGECFPITASSRCQSSDGVTDVCNVCNFGYYAISKFCRRQFILNCELYADNKNECIKCRNNYDVRDDGKCVLQSIINCSEYFRGQNVCKACKPGYIQFQNRCDFDNSPNCADYNADTNRCAQCNNLYYLNLNVCAPINKEFCQESSGVLPFCTKCQAGYYLVNGSECALQLIEYCQAYKDNENVCTQCADGFQLQNNQCVVAPVDQSE